ncbi:MAG: hypothetical protein JO368_03700, partial [Acidimicrobiales bacterium]|nr:hypothetical protein [Acidimicrobiales bacterium]
MTIDAGERAGGRTSRTGDVSGSVVNALVELTRARTGPGGVAQVLALDDDRRDFASLGDPGRWSTLAEVVALFNAASLVNQDGAVALHVGEHLLDGPRDPGGDLAVLAQASEAFAAIGEILARFDLTAAALAVEVSDDHALVRISPRPGTVRHAHLCEMSRGLLSSLPRYSGGSPALVTESECAARGGRFCLYAVSWEATEGPGGGDAVSDNGRPPHGEDVAVDVATEPGADDQPAPTTERQDPPTASAGGDTPAFPAQPVEEAAAAPVDPGPPEGATANPPGSAAAADDKDLPAVLDAIEDRARVWLGDTPYVVAIRLRPGAAPHLRSQGLSAAEAEALAGRLLTVDPVGAPPGTLVADVASPRRHFGRLAVQFAGAVSPQAAESATVELLGDYAAALLEVHAVRSDARRDNAAARALLNFSERLSRSTDLQEAV